MYMVLLQLYLSTQSSKKPWAQRLQRPLRHLFSVPASYWVDRGLRLAARQHKVEKAELLLTRVKEEKQELELILD